MATTSRDAAPAANEDDRAGAPATGLADRARAVVDCWNRSDWTAYRALLADGFCYTELGSGRCVDDVDELLAGWRRTKAAFPDAEAEVVDVLERDHAALVGLVWRATHRGAVRTPQGPESPSYARLRIADLVVLTWRDEQLVEERHRLGFPSVADVLSPVVAGE
jgi:hypothetical protein